MSKGKLAVLAVIVALVAAFFIFDLRQYLSIEYFQAQRAAIEAHRDANPVQATAAFFAIYVAVTALSLPGAAILTLVAGAVFGLAWGVVIVSFASTIGATGAFLASRYLLRDWVQGKLGDKLKTINEGVQRDGPFYLFALRLVPAFPFFLVNLVPAFAGVRLGPFIAATAIGIIPGAIVFALAGVGLDSMIAAQKNSYDQCIAASGSDCRLAFHPADVLTPQLIAALVALGLLALMPVVVKYWRARSRTAT